MLCVHSKYITAEDLGGASWHGEVADVWLGEPCEAVGEASASKPSLCPPGGGEPMGQRCPRVAGAGRRGTQQGRGLEGERMEAGLMERKIFF